MKFDREIIDVRIEKIRKNVNSLKRYSGMTLEEFVSGFEYISAAERQLQTSIESMIDIGNHIIAVAGFEAPTEYRDVFITLGKEGIFDKGFVKTLTDMVGLRNRLVHVYLEVDPKELHKFITTELSDFEKFIKIVYKYIVEAEAKKSSFNF